MEIDQIKDLWNKENNSQTPEITFKKQKEIHLPLERIRKNMRMEFYYTVVLFVMILLFFIFKDMYLFKFKVYVVTLVSAQMLITAFYFFKFFNLYKNITSVTLNTTESLRDLRYEFKLNQQYYLSFYISFVPFVVCEMLLIFEFVPTFKEIAGLHFIFWFLGSCLVMLFLLYFVGKWWFQKYYGKYIQQINRVVADLK